MKKKFVPCVNRPKGCPKQMRNLAGALAATGRAGEICEFIWGILTPPERSRILLRWEFVKLLASGVSQRQISRKLGISLCKITRGSRELKRGPVGFAKIVEKGLQLERDGR